MKLYSNKNILKTCAVLSSLLIFSISNIFASTPRFFTASALSSPDNAKQENTMVSEDNVISLAPETTVIKGIEEPDVWKLFASSTDAIFAATGGNKGRVYRMQKNEKAFRKIIETDERNITSIATGKDGLIYVAVAPEGLLYVYNKNLLLETKIKLDVQYVWDMAFDKDDILYLAVGGKEGKVLSLDTKYNVKEVVSFPTESHVMTLFYNTEDNSFYAGTEGNGLLVKFFPNGNYSVIYDTGEKEVHSVVVDEDGNVYFGTANREKNEMLQSFLFGMSGDRQNKTFRNSIYKADKKGAVQRIFYLSQTLLFSLTQDNVGNIYFATGDRSSLYRIDKNGTLLYVANFEGKSIVSSAATPENIYFASKTGTVYKMSKSYSKDGVFTSSILDTKMLSIFGSVDYLADIPNGASILIETRTGNISKPDKTWSDFAAVSAKGKIESPRARFIQYRVKFSTEDTETTPKITSMSISYLTENIAPEVYKPRLLTPYLQAKVDIEGYKKPVLKSNESMLIWSGSDPNGDTLSYTVEYKLSGESEYRSFVKNIRENYYIFERVKLPSGIYDFRITASDYLDNGIGETKEKTMEYKNFKYDIAAPVVKDMVFTTEPNGMKKARFVVEDNLSMLQSVRIATFHGLFRYITPEDGILDGKSKTFSVIIEDNNAQSVTIEASDSEGNTMYYSYIIE